MYKGFLASICNSLHELGYDIYNIIPEECTFTMGKHDKAMTIKYHNWAKSISKGLMWEQDAIDDITRVFDRMYNDDELCYKENTIEGITLKELMKEYVI